MGEGREVRSLPDARRCEGTVPARKHGGSERDGVQHLRNGNKYRLVVSMRYDRQKVFIRHVVTHEDYDRLWASGSL
jgi:hypothetical protein